ncbi:MAG: hypothetical protein R3E09_10385 [Novosphingobium sp.]|nr:hypothetical protein [Novosphingobium sp.]
MRIWLAAMLSLAVVSGTATASDRGPPGGRHRNSYANPSALIAAEIALAQLTREKGQSAALRETAARDATMLVPEPVNADDWLKDRPDPPKPVDRYTEAVWISCDGSYGVVEGSWTGADTGGEFAAVWQRQEDGQYKWLFRHPVGNTGASPAPDMIPASVADCDVPRPNADSRPQERKPGKRPKLPPPAPVNAQADHSADGTLDWRFGTDSKGVPRLLVRIRKDGQMRTVLGGELEQAPGN